MSTKAEAMHVLYDGGCTKRAHGGQSKVGSAQNSFGVVTCQLRTFDPQASNLFIEGGVSSLYPTQEAKALWLNEPVDHIRAKVEAGSTCDAYHSVQCT